MKGKEKEMGSMTIILDDSLKALLINLDLTVIWSWLGWCDRMTLKQKVAGLNPRESPLIWPFKHNRVV